jgi:hypothetical protein
VDDPAARREHAGGRRQREFEITKDGLRVLAGKKARHVMETKRGRRLFKNLRALR